MRENGWSFIEELIIHKHIWIHYCVRMKNHSGHTAWQEITHWGAFNTLNRPLEVKVTVREAKIKHLENMTSILLSIRSWQCWHSQLLPDPSVWASDVVLAGGCGCSFLSSGSPHYGVHPQSFKQVLPSTGKMVGNVRCGDKMCNPQAENKKGTYSGITLSTAGQNNELAFVLL